MDEKFVFGVDDFGGVNGTRLAMLGTGSLLFPLLVVVEQALANVVLEIVFLVDRVALVGGSGVVLHAEQRFATGLFLEWDYFTLMIAALLCWGC